MTLEDQSLLFLYKMRHDHTWIELSPKFGIGRNHLSKVFKTWLMYIYKKFRDFEVDMFAERSALPQALLKCFRNCILRKTRVLIDCTEVFIETSTDFEQQGKSVLPVQISCNCQSIDWYSTKWSLCLCIQML